MEAEARAILAQAVQRDGGKPFDPEALQEFILGLFKGKPPSMTDKLIKERRREARSELGKVKPDKSGRREAARAR
jgi:hypothetical protein